MPTPIRKTRPSDKLEKRLREIARDEAWPADRPMPTTRELADRHGPSAATVFRLLRRLEEEGELWQHPSGRFYRTAARALLERPRPVACLIRRLELCSALYREILEGISEGAGAARRAMLLWHDDVLVNHADPDRPPAFAGAAAQRVALEGFLGRHGGEAGGRIFDHVWTDEALRRSAGRPGGPGVLLYRRAPAKARMANVRADFDAAATQALAHLLGRGFTRLVPVEPFRGDPAVEEFLSALERAANTLGCAERLAPRASAHLPEQREALVAGLSVRERAALIVPEDHVAARLHGLLRAAGREAPARTGLLAVMGTDVARNAGLTRLAFDFRAMGRAAVELLADSEPRERVFAPTLHAGATT